MLFNSLEFLVFFVVVTLLYYAFPYPKRWLLLLVSSCYFYMAFVPVYLLILGFTIVVDYYAGILIESSSGKKRKLFLIASLLANIGVLAVFKYFNFLNHSFSFIAEGVGLQNPVPDLSILLPIGLSFHTFQAMSYTIEVYKGRQSAERHFGIYSLYVMFYPQLVAGPIERPQNLLHQFREQHRFDYDRVTSGLRLMLWGLLKKVVIADYLSTGVDAAYTHPEEYSGLSLLIATVFFSFQIYCDFSGYSDMAIGAARVMGFRLMRNFDRPYASRSIHEFWKRWHISLSTWFKDYLYIPLGGNRVKLPRWYLNLFIVFLVSGLWHGANWTFVVWGALHGLYLIGGELSKTWRKKVLHYLHLEKFKTLSILSTFVLVAFAWIFFRANSLSSAFFIISKIADDLPRVISDAVTEGIFPTELGLGKLYLLRSVSCIVILESLQYLHSRKNLSDILTRQPAYVRWAVYYTLFLSLICLAVIDNRQFIYFQF